jgi:phage tail-like protein
MAVPRDNPYGAFNFRVTTITDRFGDAGSVQGGFQEVSGLGMEVTLAEYRNGNDPENHTRKINNVFKTNDVTMKRGIIGSTAFFDWIKRVRDGEQGPDALSTVKIELMAEDHSGPVMTWTLTNARPIKYTGVTLNAKGGTDVAIEELVLASEKLDVA